ncbi:hypothetical protein EYF80_050933 [Liparis tanakae]|uniref:Uncharacterized protein n=1 Tax=Liparis tanakae TaxID=230148 RepID=A0A4Z2FDP9_9TELE|nr:hypothetical protein EYF80_050933 [Liparis tanakae]
MKASGVISLVPERDRKSVVAGRDGIFLRSVWEPLPDSLSELWEDLGVAQSAVGDVPDPEAEHGMGQQELGHRCETGLPFVQVLPELHHVQNLENDVSRV